LPSFFSVLRSGGSLGWSKHAFLLSRSLAPVLPTQSVRHSHPSERLLFRVCAPPLHLRVTPTLADAPVSWSSSPPSKKKQVLAHLFRLFCLLWFCSAFGDVEGFVSSFGCVYDGSPFKPWSPPLPFPTHPYRDALSLGLFLERIKSRGDWCFSGYSPVHLEGLPVVISKHFPRLAAAKQWRRIPPPFPFVRSL